MSRNSPTILDRLVLLLDQADEFFFGPIFETPESNNATTHASIEDFKHQEVQFKQLQALAKVHEDKAIKLWDYFKIKHPNVSKTEAFEADLEQYNCTVRNEQVSAANYKKRALDTLAIMQKIIEALIEERKALLEQHTKTKSSFFQTEGEVFLRQFIENEALLRAQLLQAEAELRTKIMEKQQKDLEEVRQIEEDDAAAGYTPKP